MKNYSFSYVAFYSMIGGFVGSCIFQAVKYIGG
jgi:hypothetical protein